MPVSVAASTVFLHALTGNGHSFLTIASILAARSDPVTPATHASGEVAYIAQVLTMARA